MKKYLSVLSLFISGSFGKIFGVILLSALAQLGLFYKTLLPYGSIGFETAFDYCDAQMIFAIAFLLVAVLLHITGSEFSSKCSYTLKRLRISEKQVFLCQSVYNMLCFMIFLLAEGVVIISAFVLYKSYYSDIEMVKQHFLSEQTLFLACYRNNFIHCVIPLDDVLRLIRNILLTVFLGVGSSGFAYFQRNKKFGFEYVIMLLVTVFSFVSPFYDFDADIMPTAINLCLTIFLLARIWHSGALIEDKVVPTEFDEELFNSGEAIV